MVLDDAPEMQPESLKRGKSIKIGKYFIRKNQERKQKAGDEGRQNRKGQKSKKRGEEGEKEAEESTTRRKRTMLTKHLIMKTKK